MSLDWYIPSPPTLPGTLDFLVVSPGWLLLSQNLLGRLLQRYRPIEDLPPCEMVFFELF